MNRTLLGMLRSLPEQHKSNWKDHVAKLVHAYNCTRHQTTGYSPFFLLFGRSPRLPIDLAFKMEKANDPTGYPQYVAKWKTAMQEAYAKASTAANRNAKRGKKHYDKKARSTMLNEGDRVLVRNLSPRGGPGKLRSLWEEENEKLNNTNQAGLKNNCMVDGEDQLSGSEDNTVQEQLVDGEDQPDEAEPDNVPNNDPVAGTEETVDANVANRPQRNRQPPQRLVYYAPGHAACYHCGAMISQFQQPIPQPYQFQQPIPQPYQFQQPIPQPYQFQQPIPQSYQFQQPIPQPYQFQQPIPQPYQFQQPIPQPYQFQQPIPQPYSSQQPVPQLYQFTSLEIDEPIFQPFPSDIVFQNFAPYETYQVPLRFRNNDK
ncbi:Retrovirus-related Pol poly from transposon opus, partial [Paramuricea clavata]